MERDGSLSKTGASSGSGVPNAVKADGYSRSWMPASCPRRSVSFYGL